MPQVPRYENTVNTTGFNAPRAQALGPEAFGAGLAKGLQGVGDAMSDIAKEERAKADRTAAIETRTAIDQAEVDLLYDPKEGALARRGKDAFGLEEPTLKAFDERISKIETGLATPQQKEALRLLAGQRRVEINKQIQRHVYGENKLYAEEANKASLESTLNNVATHYKDPARVEQELKFGLGVIMSDSDDKGKPPEYVKLRAESWKSKVHESVIDRLLIENPIEAQNYFNEIMGKDPDFEKPNGLVIKGNIDLYNRPKVKNTDGTTSTVRSMSVNIDGNEVLIPTVSDDGKIMSENEAINKYLKTGKHLGIFKTTKDADKYAQALHVQQDNYYLVKGSLLPETASKIEKTLKPLVTKQQGMDTALELAPLLEVKPLTEVLSEVRTRLKSNPDALNLAETQLKQMEAERRDNIKRVQDETAKPIYKRIAEIQLSGRSAKLSDIPADEWANLVKVAPEEAGKIQDAIRREKQAEDDRAERKLDRAERKADRQEREAERLQNKTTAENLTTWGTLKLNPEALKRVNLDTLVVQGKINKTQYQDLVTDQLSIKQGKGEHEAKVLSNKSAVDTVLATVKIDSKKEPEKYMKFYEALNTRMQMFERETGAKPKQEEVVKMSRGLLAEVSQDRMFFNKTVKAFEADPAKVVIPKTDRDAISKALKANGRPVTDESIRQIYLEKQIRKGGAK